MKIVKLIVCLSVISAICAGVLAGINVVTKETIAKIREKQPHAKIVLHPIFPRGKSAGSVRHADARARNDRTNALLKQFADRDGKIIWIDFNDRLVDASGWVPKTIMRDEIHPTAAGYDIWMEALAPVIGK